MFTDKHIVFNILRKMFTDNNLQETEKFKKKVVEAYQVRSKKRCEFLRFLVIFKLQAFISLVHKVTS